MGTLDKPLGIGTKIGYGLGYGAISVMLYNLFMIFFMIFMTDVAGVSPIFAGTISFVAVLWDAITDPSVGYISDNTTSKYGRRRPYMLAGLIIVSVSSVLLFTTVDFGTTAKNIYYLSFAMLFWLGLTMFDIPYNTLATDLTDDPVERTRLRYYGMVFFVICLMFLTSFVWPSVGFLSEAKGLSIGRSWQITVSIVAFVAFVLSLICWYSTRGRERADAEIDRENLLKSIKDVMKLKPYRWLLTFSFILGISQIMVQSSVIHVMIYKSGFDQGKLTFVLTAGVIFNLFWTGIAAVAGKRLTNYQIYLVSIVVSGLGMLAVPNLLDMSILVVFIAFFGFFGFSVFSLWVYGYVFAYEIGDLSELVNNKRHDGILVSYLSFVLKMGGAVGMWIIGVVLEFYGYVPNAPEQSEITIKGMTYLISVFPFILHVIALVFLLKYPLSNNKYTKVLELLEKKRAGQEVPVESITALN
jgi:glycoside/pentoside/hexuronide:cation symporter, GPH family